MACLICAGLVLGTLAAYSPVLVCDFVNFDDPRYITENRRVQNGLTLDGIVWAFTTGRGSNWHPLTWISHMLDSQLYGRNAAGHHLTNLLFHVANTLLLFGVLRKITGLRSEAAASQVGVIWRSALIAALFAWHPLHVESVAWISERKDVLSTFFFLLTIWAYARYVSESKVQGPRSNVWYGTTLLLFALGLMSKPMVVTTPFVLLLLDYWPLGRVSGGNEPSRTPGTSNFARLVREKIPFFVLAAGSSVVTFLVQKQGGSVMPLERVPFPDRILNGLIAYVGYLRKMIWPNDLAVFYPRPVSWPLSEVMFASVILIAVTGIAFLLRRSKPFAAVGWLWFLGTLAPVIGLVQVGTQAMADRYTYIPSIGVFLAVIWGGADLLRRVADSPAMLLRLLVAVPLSGCLLTTWIQVQYWKDSITLFTRAREITRSNSTTLLNLGVALSDAGRPDEAMTNYRVVLEMEPNNHLALHNVGYLLARKGDVPSAIAFYQASLKSKPDYALAHYRLGRLLAEQGNLDAATKHFEACLRSDPDAADAHHRLGAIHLLRNETDKAIESFKAALRINPDLVEAEVQLAGTLLKAGDVAGARAHYAEAVRRDPSHPLAQVKLGLLLAQQGQFDLARELFLKVLRLEPTNHVAHYNLGAIAAAQGRTPDAIAYFAKVLALKPDDTDAHIRIAALLVQSGKPEAARMHYEAVLRLKPGSPEALAGLKAATNRAGKK